MVAVPSIGRADQPLLHRPAPEAATTRRLYEQYARQIHSYCLHQLGNREEAEDATQSTFLNAFRGLQRGVQPEFEMAWLYKIAHNVCLTRQRSSTRRRRIESPGDIDALQDVIPAPQVDSDELIGLPEALSDMPKQQQRALLLREWQGLSYREIAAEMNLSQAAVETLLFRARRSLAAGLVEEPKKERGFSKRVVKGGDAGSWLTLLKSLLVTGGSKVAATVATVAATSVVAAAPSARHEVEHAVSFASADSHRPIAAHVISTHDKKPATMHAAAAGATAVAVHAVKPWRASGKHHARPAKRSVVFLPKSTAVARSQVVVTGTEPAAGAPAAATPSTPPAASPPTTPPAAPAAPAATPTTPAAAPAPAPTPAATPVTPTGTGTTTNGGTQGGGATGTGGTQQSPTTTTPTTTTPGRHGGPVATVPVTPVQPLPPYTPTPTPTPTTTTTTAAGGTSTTSTTTPATTSSTPPAATTPVLVPPMTPVIVVIHHH